MRFDRSTVAPLLWVLFASNAAAQDVAPPQHLVHDWSNHHVVFSGLTPENVAAAADADPRAWHTWVNHAGHRIDPRERDPALDPESDQRELPIHRGHRHHKKLLADWNMPIGTAIGPRVFPAKFSFDVNATPDCANDYVVFPTSSSDVPGAGGLNVRISLLGFNNLYIGPGPTGVCPTPLSPATQPSVLFAYNTSTATGGKADQSPVLSLDGKKIAFVESNDGSGSNYTAFHILTWKAGEGSLSGAAAPSNCSAGNSCMSTLVLSSTRSDSFSSPFVDYTHDTAYVGDDGGLLHKINPVFSGTPAEVMGSGWPVQLHPPFGSLVESPVYDSVSGRVFVTDNTGALYVVDAVTGTVVSAIPVTNFTPSSPIVDSTNQTVFVFGADPSFNLAVWQYDTSGTLMRNVRAGLLAGSLNVYTGTFDNNYFTSPSSGMLYFAGSVNRIASLCAVGFTGKTMNTVFSGPLALSTNPTNTPTPLTELFNPSFSTAKDRLFLGIDANCTSSGTNGCVESLDISSGFPIGVLSSYTLATNGATFSVSGIIVDNVSSSSQASSIYFESFPTGIFSQSAIKLTQSGLQ
jgi:hypothetical protein